MVKFLDRFENLSTFKIVIIIFIISIFIRLVYLFNFNDPYVMPIEDQKLYHLYALEITKNGFLNSSIEGRPVLLPAALSVIYKLTNPEINLISARLFCVLISGISIILLFFNGLLFFGNKVYSSLVSLFFSIYPPSIFYSVNLLTENLSILLILICSLLLIQILRNQKNIIYICLLGFFLGLLTLSRSAYVLLPFFIILSIYIGKYFYSKSLHISKAKSILIIFFYILTLMPWTIRNYIIYDAFVPTTTRTGYMAYLSNHDLNEEIVLNGGYIKNDNFLSTIDNIRNENDSVVTSKILFAKSLDEIFNNKTNFVEAVINRGINYLNFRPNPYKESYTKNDLIMFLFWIPILTLFLLNLLKKKKDYEIIFLILILYTFLVHLPFWGISRFRFPTDPYFILLAFNTIMQYFPNIRNDKSI